MSSVADRKYSTSDLIDSWEAKYAESLETIRVAVRKSLLKGGAEYSPGDTFVSLDAALKAVDEIKDMLEDLQRATKATMRVMDSLNK